MCGNHVGGGGVAGAVGSSRRTCLNCGTRVLDPRPHDMFHPNQFSNYEPRWLASFTCPRCSVRSVLEHRWADLTTVRRAQGPGQLPTATSPWVIPAQLAITCSSCSSAFVVHLDGTAGGRMGEVQYLVVGLQSGEEWWTEPTTRLSSEAL